MAVKLGTVKFKSLHFGNFNEKPKDKFARKRRLDEDALIEDHQQIRNVILRDLYGIKRLNQTWKKEKFPHTLFVYEKGKSKVKYHTHLFLENKNLKYDTIEAASVSDSSKQSW